MPDPISDVGPPSCPRTMGVKDLKETYKRPLPPLRGPTLIIGSRCGCYYVPIPYVDGVTRGGQTFPKSTEIRNSVAFRTVFSVFFRPCFSVVAESVSEQLL